MQLRFLNIFIPRSLCDNLHVYMCVQVNYNLSKENERERKKTVHSMYKIVLIYKRVVYYLLAYKLYAYVFKNSNEKQNKTVLFENI